MRTALVFPGQGSQYVGMGTDFLEDDDLSDWFGGVCDRVDMPLRQLIHEGPEDQLERTRYTQPAVFVVNHLIYRYLRDEVSAEIYAGHSLGEYNALVAADRTSFEELLPVVVSRGEAMDDAAQEVDGTMAAILRFDESKLKELCQTVSDSSSTDGTVQVALYNSPDQLVVSGARSAVEEVVNRADEAGALKAVTLDVSGPWHSEYMEPAEQRLQEALESVNWSDGDDVVTNVSAKFRNANEFESDLVDQLTRPVRWIESVQTMIDAGIQRFIEVGPGDALTGMIGRISDSLDTDVDVLKTDSLSNTKTVLEDL